MIGKKNVVFGFLFLVLTAALGPYMLVTQFGAVKEAGTQKQEAVTKLQPGSENAGQIAAAVVAINKFLDAQATINNIKGGPHTHGNLESLLNIVVGVALCFIAVRPLVKQLISWIFILGTLLHSGMLYLAFIFKIEWAGKILGTGAGPVLILLGLLLAGIAAAVGFRGEVVKD